MKSLTGLNIEKFKEIVPYFEIVLLEDTKQRIKSDAKRVRAEGAGKKHTLKSIEEKLFYILFYLKVYPTFDLAGFIFDADKTQACRWMHKFLPLLETALDRKFVLPKRKIATMDEFIKLFPNIKDVFADATERAVQRPANNKMQRRLYSGKKKRHTRKNTNQSVANNTVEKVSLSDGNYLTSNDINTIIQSMNSYASSHDIAITSIDSVKANQDLMNICCWMA
jgi:hypothetical protein